MVKDVRLETKVSQKTGKEYRVLIIRFINGYEKQVFLEKAEEYMIEQMSK